MMKWLKKFTDDGALPVARLREVPQFHHLLEKRNEDPSQVQKVNEFFSSVLD